MLKTEKIKLKIQEKLESLLEKSSNVSGSLQIEKKADNSIVTDLDLFISNLIKQEIKENSNLDGYAFYCEEEHGNFQFPMAILDPIDGTKELAKGSFECCLSLSFQEGPDQDKWSWIYNPFTGFEISSETRHFQGRETLAEAPLLGLFSRTEYEEIDQQMKKVIEESGLILAPRGSIAYKLALLAAGACDFVFSFRPKNIWDIAAGTNLVRKRGIKLYNQNLKVISLNKKSLRPPFLWCHPDHLPHFENVLKQFQ